MSSSLDGACSAPDSGWLSFLLDAGGVVSRSGTAVDDDEFCIGFMILSACAEGGLCV